MAADSQWLDAWVKAMKFSVLVGEECRRRLAEDRRAAPEPERSDTLDWGGLLTPRRDVVI